MTRYLDDHPGGKEILLEVAGTNATDAFEDAGHSDEAREQMEPFCIGNLPSEVCVHYNIYVCLVVDISDYDGLVGTNGTRRNLPTQLQKSLAVSCCRREEREEISLVFNPSYCQFWSGWSRWNTGYSRLS